jgi:hypothetical protein
LPKDCILKERVAEEMISEEMRKYISGNPFVFEGKKVELKKEYKEEVWGTVHREDIRKLWFFQKCGLYCPATHT